MADPFLLSTQYQERLDNSTKALEDIPRYVMEGLKIPGMISQNRILGIRAKEAQMELTSNEQLQSMIDDPAGFARKFGDLKTAKEMREYMASHSAIAITPAGQRIMGVWDKITMLKEDSEQHSIQRITDLEVAKNRASFVSEMSAEGYNPDIPGDVAAFRAKKSERALRAEAFKQGKDVSGLISQDLFDPSGRFLPGVEDKLLNEAPVSEALRIKELSSSATGQLALRRIQNEETRLKLQQMGFGLREIDQMIKARELGYEVQGGPQIPTTPEGVSLKPVERPATTATTTKLQGQSLDGARAIAALDDSIKTIQEHPEAFGLRGTVGQLVEKVKGQLNPNDPMDTPISNARQKASIAFADIAKSLRTDSGNMSKYELTKLEQAGSILDWSESPQIALMKQKNLLAVVIGQQLRNLKARNAPVDDNLLRKIDPSELIGLGQDGLLTEDELRRWYRLKP